jgi:hypothetical protein
MMKHVVDISALYVSTGTAKLAACSEYESAIRQSVPLGTDVELTGPGPIWLYLRIAHTLHGVARSLTYSSPVTGSVTIFDHNPH